MKWKSFTIDGATWKIFLVPGDHRFLKKQKVGGPFAGRARFGTNRIYVKEELSPFERRATLLHELIHVAFPKWPGGVEEEIVRVLERPLTRILEQLLEGWPE